MFDSNLIIEKCATLSLNRKYGTFKQTAKIDQIIYNYKFCKILTICNTSVFFQRFLHYIFGKFTVIIISVML